MLIHLNLTKIGVILAQPIADNYIGDNPGTEVVVWASFNRIILSNNLGKFQEFTLTVNLNSVRPPFWDTYP
jgi:hypothetical protein